MHTSASAPSSGPAMRSQLAEIDALEVDHRALSDTLGCLGDLPQRLAHEVMVPFGGGNVASFRGSLVHTNEVMARLGPGSELYAMRSAPQASEMLRRREKLCAAKLQTLKGSVAGMIQQDEVFEITEPYDEGDDDAGAGETKGDAATAAGEAPPSIKREAGQVASGAASLAPVTDDEHARMMARLEEVGVYYCSLVVAVLCLYVGGAVSPRRIIYRDNLFAPIP